MSMEMTLSWRNYIYLWRDSNWWFAETALSRFSFSSLNVLPIPSLMRQDSLFLFHTKLIQFKSHNCWITEIACPPSPYKSWVCMFLTTNFPHNKPFCQLFHVVFKSCKNEGKLDKCSAAFKIAPRRHWSVLYLSKKHCFLLLFYKRLSLGLKT